jgi:hypothetical protein
MGIAVVRREKDKQEVELDGDGDGNEDANDLSKERNAGSG